VEDESNQKLTVEAYIKVNPSEELYTLPYVADYLLEVHQRDYVPGKDRPSSWVTDMSAS